MMVVWEGGEGGSAEVVCTFGVLARVGGGAAFVVSVDCDDS